MKESPLKSIIRSLLFPAGAVRKVRFGPMRGMVFRVGPVTNLSPWYSGNERNHQEWFKGTVCPGDVVVDVGANWGLHTLYLSQLVGRQGLVIAFEPLPAAFRELEWHVKANDCRNVKMFLCALSNTDGKTSFSLGPSPSEGTLGEVSPNPGGQTKNGSSILVITQRLDTILEELGIQQLKIVKIDVEGGESLVLAGAQKTLAVLRPHFLISLHGPAQGISVAKILIQHGYTLKRLSGPPITRTDIGWPHREGVWGDIVASP